MVRVASVALTVAGAARERYPRTRGTRLVAFAAGKPRVALLTETRRPKASGEGQRWRFAAAVTVLLLVQARAALDGETSQPYDRGGFDEPKAIGQRPRIT